MRTGRILKQRTWRGKGGIFFGGGRAEKVFASPPLTNLETWRVQRSLGEGLVMLLEFYQVDGTSGPLTFESAAVDSDWSDVAASH